ncbi:MAG: hypothetical protein MUC53_13350 [Candidatus Contendobacter sp.]|nr:hypothetical protein [Candidatus Contendobacter sp.]
MQALSGATASTALVEQARLDSDALRLKQEELQTSIASAKPLAEGCRVPVSAPGLLGRPGTRDHRLWTWV